MARVDDNTTPYTPPPVNKMIEDKFPYEKQMEKLRELMQSMYPPPPPPVPTRWELFKNMMRGRS